MWLVQFDQSADNGPINTLSIDYVSGLQMFTFQMMSVGNAELIGCWYSKVEWDMDVPSNSNEWSVLWSFIDHWSETRGLTHLSVTAWLHR